MKIIQNVYSDVEFHKELIKRFFHPKSYFFNCLSNRLESILDSSENSQKEIYLLFANLIDRLVATENKVREMESLAKIEGFNNFYETLNNGVKYLQHSDLNPEQMKKEIESLAHSMVNTALEALNNEETSKQLKEYLGFTNLEKIEEEQKDIDEQVSQFSINEDILEIAEPPSEETGEVVTEGTLEHSPDFSELDKNEERESLQSDEAGKEASMESRSDSDLTDGGGSVNIALKENTRNLSSVNEEPFSIVRAFFSEIEIQLKELQKSLDFLNEDPKNKEYWLRSHTIVENIKEISMIYGFEAFEQIATKAKNFISNSLNELKSNSSFNLSLLTETKDVLHSMVQGDFENFDERVIKNLIRKLKNPHSSNYEETPEHQDIHSPQNTDNEVEEFKLPGEDDEEILNLVKEISKNNKEQNSDGSQTLDLGEMEDFNKEDEKQDKIFDESSRIIAKGELPSSDASLKVFKEEAELYFNVIDDALNTLVSQPTNKAALDDLELASYSLYGLTVKLNLEPLGKLPEAIENLVKNIISRNSSLSEKKRKAIEKAYQQFRKVTRIEDIENHSFKEVFDLIHNVQKESLHEQKLSLVSKKTDKLKKKHWSHTRDFT